MTRLRLQSSCGIAGGDLKSAGAPLSSCAYKVRAHRNRLLGLSALRRAHRGSGIHSSHVQQELCIAPWSAWTLPNIVGWFGTNRRPRS